MAMLRIATYNIHKGVQGFWPTRRLEIHNLGLAVEQMDADVVCLQEVRKGHRGEALHFPHWPDMPQAEFLAPEGYHAVYRTNAVTRFGEHGNALLSRWPVVMHQHEDMSDHRFEQRGLLHTVLDVQGQHVHVLVVHFGLIKASRIRQLEQLLRFIAREVPGRAPLIVAGDFNDWSALVPTHMRQWGFAVGASGCPTFPSRLPLLQLDHVYVRGMRTCRAVVPKGRVWARMSDHLPLIVECDLPPVAV